MSDNKLVKTIMAAATLTGFAAGIGWIGKKVVKENFTNDPSSNVMNYAKFVAVMAASIARFSMPQLSLAATILRNTLRVTVARLR